MGRLQDPDNPLKFLFRLCKIPPAQGQLGGDITRAGLDP